MDFLWAWLVQRALIVCGRGLRRALFLLVGVVCALWAGKGAGLGLGPRRRAAPLPPPFSAPVTHPRVPSFSHERCPN